MSKYNPQTKYDKDNTIPKKIKLNKNTDKDIIEKLDEIDNFQGYVKKLIREDIRGGK